MIKKMKKAYGIMAVLLAVLAVYYIFAFRVDQRGEAKNQGYTRLVPLEGSRTGNVTLKLEGINGDVCHLMFYSIHSTVEVYHGSYCIYSMTPARKNVFSKMTGCVWNNIALPMELEGEEINIILTPVYKGVVYDNPEFYLGDIASLSLMIYQKDLLQIFLCCLLILVGGIILGFVWYNLKNTEVDKNLAFLGIFAVQLGLWKLSDSSAFKWIFNGFPVFSMLPFMGLMMAVVPWVLFFQNQNSTREKTIWYVPSWLSLGTTGIILVLQYLDLADFRQTFPLVVLSVMVGICVVVYMVYREYKESGWNHKLRDNIIWFGAMVAGVFLDLVTYYGSGCRRTSPYALIIFLLYAIRQGARIVADSRVLMVAGEGAQVYEDLAFHDKLTGLYNRAAFVVDTDPYEVEPEDHFVVVMDLNNLKICNDTLGHDRGDDYIRESASIIQSTFGQIGKCYRMGGDEFYCLISGSTFSACKEIKALLDAKVEEYNKDSKDIRMGIACGIARFDSRIDYDLRATSKRADKEMYRNKEKMKQEV